MGTLPCHVARAGRHKKWRAAFHSILADEELGISASGGASRISDARGRRTTNWCVRVLHLRPRREPALIPHVSPARSETQTVGCTEPY